MLLNEGSLILQEETGHPLLPQHQVSEEQDISDFWSEYDIDLLKFVAERGFVEEDGLRIAINDVVGIFGQVWHADTNYLSMFPQLASVLFKKPPLHELVVLTLDIHADKLSLPDVLKIKKCFCSVLGLPLHTVLFAGYEEGSVKLKFFIPRGKMGEVSEDNCKKRRKLHELYHDLLLSLIHI